jgi:hypothetical protein
MEINMLKVEIHNDPDCLNPLESGDAGMTSFNHKHVNFEHPDKYFENGAPNEELQAMLSKKTAFILSYFKHGACVWGLRGEVPQCPWDTVQVAGILFVSEEIPEDSREDFARSTLKTYSSWLNDECYGYIIRDGEDEDSCWGYIGDSVFEAVAEIIGDREYEIEDDHYRSLIEDYVKKSKGKIVVKA